jgi:hypothetical protein
MSPAAAKIKKWREDPVAFVREVFGAEPDDWQIEVLRAFPVNQRLAMQACKGPGKTCLLAWLVWNFLATRPQPKVACTSVTADNLADNLWTEIAKWQKKSPWLSRAFQWTKTKVQANESPETWWASARTWPRSADAQQQADTLAGLHADYILFVLDEVGSIPDSVMAAAEAALASGIECKLLIAGNPTMLSGPLYRAATKERKLWHLTTITGDPDDPRRSKRISAAWAREQIEKYGKDSPWVLVNVFGRFPPASINSLLGVEEVTAAMGRSYKPMDYDSQAKIIGVDVARFGDDLTVLFPRQGLCAMPPVELRNADTLQVAGRLALANKNWQPDANMVDGTGGTGAGVIDVARGLGIEVTEVNFSGSADNPKFFNRRTEMYFKLAAWVRSGGALPNVPELVADLTEPTYSFKGDKMILEPKDSIKERLGRSPDHGDALACTFAYEVSPRYEPRGAEGYLSEASVLHLEEDRDPLEVY